ncbi:LemA family protein [Dyella ginsengisoli]|uniref:LemA family protein n=1 Tax=Dyella ginsengisoli TaxID=363848 RepID=UPI00034AFF37|nr:LemA family protein [Dyella ginsengisoli]
MEIKVWVLIASTIAVAAYLVALYNSLVQFKNNVAKAWANIDVLLKQRHDELPKLVETCKQYMGYEQPALERVVAARAKVSQAMAHGSPEVLGQAEAGLRSGLGQLYAVAENYPELKADQSFRFLQTRISGLENAIADRREFYNDSVNALNVRREQFPDRLLASAFNIGGAELLHFSSEETRDVDIKALFG